MKRTTPASVVDALFKRTFTRHLVFTRACVSVSPFNMKIRTLCFHGLLAQTFILGPSLLAKDNGPGTEATKPPLVSAPPADPSASSPKRARFTRKWNESSALLKVTVDNSADSALVIDGVQTTPNLYVVDFPKTIKPKGSDTITVRYAARAGTTGDTDAVRLLTNQGEKEIEVVQDREAAFALDSQSVSWKVGDKLEARTVTLTLQQTELQAVRLRVFGGKFTQAQLQAVSPGKYQIVITPESTAAATQFSVMVELAPGVPGNIPLIRCSVTAN